MSDDNEPEEKSTAWDLDVRAFAAAIIMKGKEPNYDRPSAAAIALQAVAMADEVETERRVRATQVEGRVGRCAFKKMPKAGPPIAVRCRLLHNHTGDHDIDY